MAVDYVADDYVEQMWRRQHNRNRQEASKIAQRNAKALEAGAEKTTKKIIAKVLPKVASASGVGILISFIVLLIRGISANLLGNKTLPKLNMKEKFHLGALMFVVFLLIIFVTLLLFIIMIGAMGAVEAVKYLGSEIVDWLKELF